MDKALVSILMTSYNSEKFIKEAIDSVISQTHENWELLIADDCSSDNTRDIIALYNDSRIRVHHNDKRMHYLRTRNRLIEFVKGDFIALLDSDDIYQSTKLEKQLLAFENDPSLHLIGTKVSYVNAAGFPLKFIDYKPINFQEIIEKIQYENVFTGSTIMVRKKTWIELGGYRDFFSMIGYEDYDLTSRLVEKYKAINLSEPLYLYRQYQNSSSKKDLIYNPFKLHGHLLVRHLIQQRIKFGYDSIEKNDIPEIIRFIVDCNKPYIEDPSLVYRNLIWSSIRRENTKIAFKQSFKSLSIKPFKWDNWKTLILISLIAIGFIKH